jgi:hypothetical protein
VYGANVTAHRAKGKRNLRDPASIAAASQVAQVADDAPAHAGVFALDVAGLGVTATRREDLFQGLGIVDLPPINADEDSVQVITHGVHANLLVQKDVYHLATRSEQLEEFNIQHVFWGRNKKNKDFSIFKKISSARTEQKNAGTQERGAGVGKTGRPR